jgi:hypothetical protein
MASTARQIKHLLRLPTTNYPELVSVIQRDPGLSIQVFREINRDLGKNRDPIATLIQAIPLLGTTWLETSVNSLPCLEEDYPAEVKEGLYDCYSRILYAMAYATYWAQLRGDDRAEELVVATLLDHASEIMFWLCEPETARKIALIPSFGLARSKGSRSALIRCAIEDLNVSLIITWNLPRMRPSPRLRGVAIAAALSKESMEGWDSPEMERILGEAVKHVNKDPEIVIAGVHSRAAETAREYHELGLPCPVPQMLYLSTPEEEAGAEEELLAEGEIASEEHTPQAPAGSKSGLQEIMLRSMQEMHEMGEMSRTAFMIYHRDKNTLQTLLVNEESGSDINKFVIEANSSNIFGLLLRKPCALWMNAENLAKYAKLIPAEVNEQVNSQNFFIMSLFSKQHPIGVMFADGGEGGATLSEADYECFRRLCQRIVNSLGQY